MFTKMVLKDTLLIPDFAVDSDYRMPFFIDVLPVDNIPADPVAFKRMARASWLWGRLLFLHGTAKPFLPGISGTKKQLIYTATTGANWALKAAKLSPQTLQRRWEKAVRAWEHTPTTRMADFTMRDPENWIITNSELLPTVRVPFEDITVQLPAQYDAWLRRGYGDYMQLPPTRGSYRSHSAHRRLWPLHGSTALPAGNRYWFKGLPWCGYQPRS